MPKKSRGSRALIDASCAGKQDVALSPIEHGTNLNVTDSLCSTPLIEATWQGSLPFAA